jgi:hypothetical protein
VITTFVGRAGVRRHYGNTITLCPPLVITQAECDRIVDTLDRALGIPSAASIAGFITAADLPYKDRVAAARDANEEVLRNLQRSAGLDAKE